MKFFAAVAALAATALAAPAEKREPCEAGTYRCDADGASIDVCNAQGQWEVAGPCPDGTVCNYLPQDGFSLPFCVNPTEKRDAPASCSPSAYTCAKNPATGASGIQVCDSQNAWEVSRKRKRSKLPPSPNTGREMLTLPFS